MKKIFDDIVYILIGFFILLVIASGIAILWVFGDSTDGRIMGTGLFVSSIALDIGFIISETIKLKRDIRNLDYKIEYDNRLDVYEIKRIIDDEKEKAMISMNACEKATSDDERIYDLAIEIDCAIVSNNLSLDDRRSIARTLVNLGYVKKEVNDEDMR